MSRFHTHIMMALMILASALLPGSAVECNTEDNVLMVNLDDLGIHLGGCRHRGCDNVIGIDFSWDDLDD